MPPRKTHCQRGHRLTGVNVYVHPTGARRCRTCRSLKSRQRYHANPERWHARLQQWRAGNRSRYLTNDRSWRAARVAAHRALIYDGKVCTVCTASGGNTYYTRLECDHVPGHRKCFDIGNHLTMSLGARRRELKKCEPVCHSCHAKRTKARASAKRKAA